MENVEDELESIMGIEALSSLLKDKDLRESVKKSFLFSLKTIPGTAAYFKLLQLINQKNVNFTDLPPEVVYNWAASLVAIQLSSNKLYSVEERENLFIFFYVILKRLIWILVYSTQGRPMDSKSEYFLEYSTGILKDALEAYVLGSRG